MKRKHKTFDSAHEHWMAEYEAGRRSFVGEDIIKHLEEKYCDEEKFEELLEELKDRIILYEIRFFEENYWYRGYPSNIYEEEE